MRRYSVRMSTGREPFTRTVEAYGWQIKEEGHVVFIDEASRLVLFVGAHALISFEEAS